MHYGKMAKWRQCHERDSEHDCHVNHLDRTKSFVIVSSELKQFRHVLLPALVLARKLQAGNLSIKREEKINLCKSMVKYFTYFPKSKENAVLVSEPPLEEANMLVLGGLPSSLPIYYSASHNSF